jgi:ABC-2 type transport system permease protein
LDDNKIFQVARWEFIEKVKTKAFLISLIMMPLIIGIFGFLPTFLASKPDENTKTVGVIDQTENLVTIVGDKLTEEFKLPNGKPNYAIMVITDENTDLEHLKKIGTAKMLSGAIDGYFVIPSDVMKTGTLEYRSENVGNIRDQERFSRVIENIIIEQRLIENGYDAKLIKQLSTKVDVKTIKVGRGGEEKESGFIETFMSGYIFIMMLMFLVITSGQMLIRSMVEEKSNRIVEVLLSSCTPKQLMSGKVLGLSLLGLTTVSFWMIILIGVNFSVSTPFVSFDHLALLLLYFVLGYLLYAAIFIAVGAPISTEQEAQQATSIVSLTLVFPIALAIPIMQNPNSVMTKVLSQIPLFTPAFMALRFAIQRPEWWEIGLSLVTLSISIVVMMWAASKIFRIGILITGKRPTYKEMVRWLTTEV